MIIKIYHNPRCRKSREGLNFLQNKGVDILVIEYLKKGISIEDIREIVLKLNISPKDLVRKNEKIFKKELKSLELNDEEWIKVISENPILLRRPVVLAKNKGVIGDQVGQIEKIL